MIEGKERRLFSQKADLNVLGLMSGTSGDGVDGALVRFQGNANFSLLWHDSMDFTSEQKCRIQSLMHSCTGEEAALAAAYMAELYARAVERFRGKNAGPIDFLAAHGQTLAHVPNPVEWDGIPLRGTLQAMNAGWLAERTGFAVVHDFRARDLAVGGQGAPLVPFGDLRFFSRISGDSAVLNIGGIANITVLRKHPVPHVSLAFDTGPGNMLMDALALHLSDGKQAFDADGEIARKGKTDRKVLENLLQDPYLRVKPPKSTGRDRFGAGCFAMLSKRAQVTSLASSDFMSTLLDFTIESIACAVEEFVLPEGSFERVIVAGGGARNPELLQRLKARLARVRNVEISDEYGVPAQAREAMAFAALGDAFVRSRPSGVPAATGGKKSVVLGSYTPAPGGE